MGYLYDLRSCALVRPSGVWKATQNGAWIAYNLLHNRPNDAELGGKTCGTGFHLVPYQPQICAQRPANMIALRSFAPHPAALDATELLDVAMIRLNCPTVLGPDS